MGNISTFPNLFSCQLKFGAQTRLADGEVDQLSAKAKENLDAGKAILLPDKFAVAKQADRNDSAQVKLIPRADRGPKRLPGNSNTLTPQQLAAWQVSEAPLRNVFLSKIDDKEIAVTSGLHTTLARFDAATYWAYKTYGKLIPNIKSPSIIEKDALPIKPTKILDKASLIDPGIYKVRNQVSETGFVYPHGTIYKPSPAPNALSTNSPSFILDVPKNS